MTDTADPEGIHLVAPNPIAQPAAVPQEILKRKGAINLYYTAVGAIAAVVVFIPVITIWAHLPDAVWNGWMLSLGGLITLLGAQSAAQGGAQ